MFFAYIIFIIWFYYVIRNYIANFLCYQELITKSTEKVVLLK